MRPCSHRQATGARDHMPLGQGSRREAPFRHDREEGRVVTVGPVPEPAGMIPAGSGFTLINGTNS